MRTNSSWGHLPPIHIARVGVCDWRHSLFCCDLKLGGPAEWLIMPTDLGAVSGRERKAQAQTQTDTTIITIVLVWFIICLGFFVLLFADQSFSKAAIELMCLF
jgi:hypothetical protein